MCHSPQRASVAARIGCLSRLAPEHLEEAPPSNGVRKQARRQWKRVAKCFCGPPVQSYFKMISADTNNNAEHDTDILRDWRVPWIVQHMAIKAAKWSCREDRGGEQCMIAVEFRAACPCVGKDFLDPCVIRPRVLERSKQRPTPFHLRHAWWQQLPDQSATFSMTLRALTLDL